jgi:pyrimidine deaminase RibD-like protein
MSQPDAVSPQREPETDGMSPPDEASPPEGDPSRDADPPTRTGRRRAVAAVVGILAVAAVVLAGLYVSAEGDLRDQRRRAAELAARNAAADEQLADLRAQLAAKEQQLTAEQARFTAVEPCLRQLISPPPAKPLTDAERRRIAEAIKKVPPGAPGSLIELVPIGGTLDLTALLPACKDIEQKLR